MQLTTTEIGAHFGITMSTDFIVNTLGVPNDGTLKRASLWDVDKLPVIADALAAHVKARGDAKVAFKPTKPVKAPKTTGAAEPNSDLW